MVGDQGKWQIVVFLFTWIEGVLIGMYHLSSTFLGAQVMLTGGSSDLVSDEDELHIHFQMDHWCNTSHIEALDGLDWTLEQKKNYSIPM